MHVYLNKHVKLLQSCPTLCDPMDCSPPGSSVHGILQARILLRVAISSSRGSSRPRDQTCVSSSSCIGRQVLHHSLHPYPVPRVTPSSGCSAPLLQRPAGRAVGLLLQAPWPRARPLCPSAAAPHSLHSHQCFGVGQDSGRPLLNRDGMHHASSCFTNSHVDTLRQLELL